MSESIFKEVTLRRKEILEKVNPKNVELAQSYLKYINISNFEKSTVSTKIQLLLHYLNYIHENLDDKLVTDIAVSDMEDYLLYLGKCGLQPNSISAKMNGLSVFYMYLINKGVTMFNPIYYIPKPHKMKTEDNRHFLTREQIEILRDKLEENGDRTLQVYAFFLQMDRGTTYILCEEWKQFENFEKWYNENYYEVEADSMEFTYRLFDVDNTILSPDTSCFLPRSINRINKRNYQLIELVKQYECFMPDNVRKHCEKLCEVLTNGKVE